MRNPGGVFIYTSPEGEVVTESFTCGHCGNLVEVKPKQDPANIGGLCKCCMKLICAGCVARGNCDPFEKKLLRAEARGIALRSYGL